MEGTHDIIGEPVAFNVGTADLSLYSYGEVQGTQLWGASTPGTRELLVDQRVTGSAFASPLSEAAAEIASFISHQLGDGPQTTLWNQICILRDGLSFTPKRAAHKDDTTSFIALGRNGIEPFRLYSSWSLLDGRPAFLGDIVATGGTLAYVLRDMAAQFVEQGLTLPSLTVLAIATHDSVTTVCTELGRIRAQLGSSTTTRFIFLEGLFTLPDEQQRKGPLFGVWDLLQRDMISVPDFEEFRFQRWTAMLERCVVYDGGDRAFAPARHWEKYLDYWSQAADVYTSFADCLKARQLLGPDALERVVAVGTYPAEFFERTNQWQQYCAGRQSFARIKLAEYQAT